ncbi:hypothetical protein F4801DRAFT_65779 [Xylaria longipes]|nr:hypothetical protein F4801DRAFT_65779 [Xylaria longipes]
MTGGWGRVSALSIANLWHTCASIIPSLHSFSLLGLQTNSSRSHPDALTNGLSIDALLFYGLLHFLYRRLFDILFLVPLSFCFRSPTSPTTSSQLLSDLRFNKQPTPQSLSTWPHPYVSLRSSSTEPQQSFR